MSDTHMPDDLSTPDKHYEFAYALMTRGKDGDMAHAQVHATFAVASAVQALTDAVKDHREGMRTDLADLAETVTGQES